MKYLSILLLSWSMAWGQDSVKCWTEVRMPERSWGYYYCQRGTETTRGPGPVEPNQNTEAFLLRDLEKDLSTRRPIYKGDVDHPEPGGYTWWKMTGEGYPLQNTIYPSKFRQMCVKGQVLAISDEGGLFCKIPTDGVIKQMAWNMPFPQDKPKPAAAKAQPTTGVLPNIGTTVCLSTLCGMTEPEYVPAVQVGDSGLRYYCGDGGRLYCDHGENDHPSDVGLGCDFNEQEQERKRECVKSSKLKWTCKDGSRELVESFDKKRHLCRRLP